MTSCYKQGFTLIEVVVTAVIVVILAAVAIPLYHGYVTNASKNDAKARCELIGAAILQTHNRGTPIPVDNDWGTIGVLDPSGGSWNYSFPAYPINPLVADNLDYKIKAAGIGLMSGTNINFLPYKIGDARWP